MYKFTKLFVNNKVSQSGQYAFMNVSRLEHRVELNNIYYELSEDETHYTCLGMINTHDPNSINVTIVDNIYGKPVTIIEDSAFAECELLESVVIPNSVTWIGDTAFCECLALKNVTIGNSVTYIGDSAFSNCTALTSIILPDSVNHINYSAFEMCSALTEVTLGNGITTISPYAFTDCISLTSINIPGNVKVIGDHAFYNCRNLQTVTICEGVETIGTSAFVGCINMTSISIPGSVMWIGISIIDPYAPFTTTIPGSFNWYFTDSETDWSNRVGGTSVNERFPDDDTIVWYLHNESGHYFYKI